MKVAPFLTCVDDTPFPDTGRTLALLQGAGCEVAFPRGARVAVAETGTTGLDHGLDQGRRALTLVPDLHVCVLRRDQIVATVPEGLGRLRSAAAEGRPVTLVSGPSAPSDIELERVEGVPGPRRLVVLMRH